jgi:hypothetical protein
MATTLDKLMIANNIFAAGAGIYHGYCIAHGIELDPQSFAASTLYGPSLLMAGFASMKSMKGEYEKNPGMMEASIAGFIQGGVVTAAGFGAGYLIGLATK